MKIVQSFWTKPSIDQTKYLEARGFGGWYQKKYFYMSWALSCLQLRKFYDRVELVTDEAGKELLIDKLRLPYTNCVVTLDKLNKYSSKLWAVGKLYTYSLQDAPFIHVDGDVFVWEKFPNRLTESVLVAQHREFNYPYYSDVYSQMATNSIAIPRSIEYSFRSDNCINAFNMGIAGGADTDFFKDYVREAFTFVDANTSNLDKLSAGQFNAMCEQALFYGMVLETKRTIELFSNTTGEESIDSEMKSLEAFQDAPTRVKFIHLYGNCKKDPKYCEELERKLFDVAPDIHQLILMQCE